MTAQAGLSPQAAALIATANYGGYLVGALIGIAYPGLVRFRAGFRWSLVAVVASLATMPLTGSAVVWAALRCLGGVASAAVFMTAAAALLTHVKGVHSHLAGWGYAGVGIGIALTGASSMTLCGPTGWQSGWMQAAVLAAVAACLSWTMPLDGARDQLARDAPKTPSAGDERAGGTTHLPTSQAQLARDRPEPGPGTAARSPGRRRKTVGASVALTVSYGLEGVGYVIAGTFLLAAIDATAWSAVGPAAWVLVGLAAAPSCAAWTGLSRRFPAGRLLPVLLTAQSVGLALAATRSGAVGALIAALLFGGTFMGAVALTMALGRQLPFPRAVAVLTAAYAAGQIVGPLITRMLVSHGYRPALGIGAAVVLVAAATSLRLARLGGARRSGVRSARASDGVPVPRSAGRRAPAKTDAHPNQGRHVI
jgi:hypothetical protein